MHYIRVNTPFALDNASPTELLLKICIETECTLDYEIDSGLWAQNNLFHFSLRQPKKLRPEMINKIPTYAATTIEETCDFNDEVP